MNTLQSQQSSSSKNKRTAQLVGISLIVILIIVLVVVLIGSKREANEELSNANSTSTVPVLTSHADDTASISTDLNSMNVSNLDQGVQ